VRRIPTDGQVHEIELPGLGGYRVEAVGLHGDVVVAGLPVRDVDSTVAKLVLWQGLLGLAAVLVAALVGQALVRRQLRPLRRVAATAHQVAALPLASGEVGRTVRVPEPLTDPRTEVGQVGAALNTLLAHVENALDARHRSEQQVRRFVADASHELRTPLATIQGYAELSRRSGDASDLARSMGKVESEAQRMARLVEDLLLLARLDAGRPLERRPVDLTKLVLEAVDDARVLGPEHRWVLRLPEEPLVVTGDELRLHQVLTNLLNNARRHTPAGTTVTVTARREPGAVSLDVHDDGPGLPPELSGSAFERFTRGDSSRTRASGGAGLGLSLVHAITAAHGGTVSVSSRPGDTTFTVRLPR
jgi:two-component system OmpR family sensor kinase